MITPKRSTVLLLISGMAYALVAVAMSSRAAAQAPIQAPGQIQQPKGNWQVPGEIQKPTGPWQKPGAIQVPKGIQAIKQESARCERRLSVGADALFDFNKSDLNPDAEKTLDVLGPMIKQLGNHKAVVEGHTDSIGSLTYNQELSEKRATTVKDWLVTHNDLPAATPIKGYGKTRPIEPNTNPDGSDNPTGRQRNRRVDVVIDTCSPNG
ncbi:MAG TPA: OmpA family protein [Candidatus Binataceae bacterium]|nr:OmpA family protein [Candidatus Binataceae bacterium]